MEEKEDCYYHFTAGNGGAGELKSYQKSVAQLRGEAKSWSHSLVLQTIPFLQ